MQHPHLLHSTCTNPCCSLSSAPACAAFWALRNGGQVAQLVEHSIENAGVPGSTPGLPTINYAADGWRRQFPAWYALVLAKPSLVSAGEKPLRPMRSIALVCTVVQCSPGLQAPAGPQLFIHLPHHGPTSRAVRSHAMRVHKHLQRGSLEGTIFSHFPTLCA